MDTLSEAQIIEIDGGDFRTRYRWILSELTDLNAPALAAQCYRCETPMSWRQWLTSANHADTECSQCGKTLYFDDCTADLPSEELIGELRAPGYFDRTWYHATRTEDWIEAVRKSSDGELIVHAGDKLTALSRADYLRSVSREEGADTEPIYLYSFTLSSTEGFSTAVLNDCDEAWQERLGKPYLMDVLIAEQDSREQMIALSGDRPGATYYNCYELPGTLSVLFAAQLIDASSVSTEILI